MAKRAQLEEVVPMLDEMNNELDKIEAFLDAVEAGADKTASAVEHGLEKAVDVVPETLDKGVHVAAEGTRKIARGLRSPRNMLILISLSGAVAGAALGVVAYRIQKKRIEKKLQAEFEAKLDAEIEGMRKFYEQRSKTGKYATPKDAAAALLPKSREAKLVDDAVEALDKYEGDQPPPGIISPEDDPREGSNSRVRYDKVKTKRDAHGRFVPNGQLEDAATEALEKQEQAEPEEVTRNVFVQQASIDDWDQEREEASRNPESPYVISHDEFMENAYEHGQNSLVYYAGDDLLADERDQHIDEVEATVGVDNLQLFGHGSRDSNIVYIRNERIEIDFEITRNQGTYSEEVLGFQHSDLPSSRFRHGRKGDDG